MEALQPKRIRAGQMSVYVGFGLLILTNIIMLVVLMLRLGPAEVDSLFYWQSALFLVCALGTLRGSKRIRYIFAFLLVIGIVALVGLFRELPGIGIIGILLILEIALRVFVTYLIMLDGRVEDFFIAQRAKYYGQRVQIAPDSADQGNANHNASAAKSKPKSKRKEKKDRWEDLEELYEDD